MLNTFVNRKLVIEVLEEAKKLTKMGLGHVRFVQEATPEEGEEEDG